MKNLSQQQYQHQQQKNNNGNFGINVNNSNVVSNKNTGIMDTLFNLSVCRAKDPNFLNSLLFYTEKPELWGASLFILHRPCDRDPHDS